MPRASFRTIIEVVAAVRPDLEDPAGEVAAGRVVVGGVVITNPAARVRADAPVTVIGERVLRGEAKLTAALDAFEVDVAGRIALDAGAAAGGFTRVLLARGASRVYAVDAGHGQLLGELRQDPRVVNLERTNIGDLSRSPVPDPIGIVAMDLSYLSIANALPQLEAVTFEAGADLVALVKPMFELGLPSPPTSEGDLDRAVAAAEGAASRAPWRVIASMPSPVTGARGAREFLLHARRT